MRAIFMRANTRRGDAKRRALYGRACAMPPRMLTRARDIIFDAYRELAHLAIARDAEATARRSLTQEAHCHDIVAMSPKSGVDSSSEFAYRRELFRRLSFLP